MDNSSTTNSAFIQVSKDVIDLLTLKKLPEELTSSEYKIWLRLCLLDPFGNQWISAPSWPELAVELGISEKTVSRAIAKFIRLELFDISVEKWSFRNKNGRYYNENKQKSEIADKPVHRKTNLSTERQTCPQKDKLVQEKTNLSSLHNKDRARALQINSDLFRSLSDCEREKFLNFCQQQANQLPKPPVLLDKWIEKNCDLLMAKFQEDERPRRGSPALGMRDERPRAGFFAMGMREADEDQSPSAAVTQVNADILPDEVIEGIKRGIIETVHPLWELGTHELRIKASGRWVKFEDWVQDSKALLEGCLGGILERVGHQKCLS